MPGVGEAVSGLSWQTRAVMSNRTHRRAARLLSRGLAAALTCLGTGIAWSAGSPSAQAAVTCRSAVGFSRVGNGALYALRDANVLSGKGTLKETGLAGTGWTGSNFAWVGSGGEGVVYALTWSGLLKWYLYDPAAKAWRSGSGRTIGAGLVPRSKISNITIGGDGMFYVVRTDGTLVLYRHTGRLTGAASWASGGGWVIGSGWTGQEIIVPNGDGTIYVQSAGTLSWLRHSDPALGPVTWSGRRVVGRGWRFYDLLPGGAGVIYATQGGSGRVLQYRHSDPGGGANRWVSPAGLPKYTARADSFGVVIDPMACSENP